MINRRSQVWAGAERLSRLAFILLAALALSACAQSKGSDIFNFGPIADAEPETAPANMSKSQTIAHYSSLYGADPSNKENALSYAEALRNAGEHKRALTILRTASVHHDKDPEFLSAYGRAALVNGNASAAAKILAKADIPDRPDWRTVSARGTAYAQLGKYQDARKQFERAAELAPANPSVMNNLAMAKAATGDLKAAETLLRDASLMPVIDPKVKENLAIVLSLQGRTQEAEKLKQKGPSLAMRSTIKPTQSEGLRNTQVAHAQ